MKKFFIYAVVAILCPINSIAEGAKNDAFKVTINGVNMIDAAGEVIGKIEGGLNNLLKKNDELKAKIKLIKIEDDDEFNSQIVAEDLPKGFSVRINGEHANQMSKFHSHLMDLPAEINYITIDFLKDNELYLTYNHKVDYSDKWFFIGLVEATFGISDFKNSDDIDKTGRAAFYAKGELHNDVNITAQADTGEGDIKDIISNFDEKDPRHLVRRLEDEIYYPTYGDGSTVVDDTASMGKFYGRIEHEDDYILWGNFHTSINDNELARVDRSLYGASGKFTSERKNEMNEPVLEVEAFAALPGTEQAYEEFRGTGGSLYYLKHQDITRGSVKVAIEVRDRIANQVLERSILLEPEDYIVNHIQGRITLNSPLSSTADDGRFFQNRGLTGNHAYLVVNYEYSTSLSKDFDKVQVGGRVTARLSSRVKVGFTVSSDGDGNDIAGVDATYDIAENSFIKAEAAVSQGVSVEEDRSLDGGFTYNNSIATGVNNVDDKATALKVTASVDTKDFTETFGSLDLTANVFYETKDDGFAGLGQVALYESQNWGANLHSKFSDNLGVRVDYAEVHETGGREARNIETFLEYKPWEDITFGAGVTYDFEDSIGVGSDQGGRYDIGARAEYAMSDESDVYIFAQGTIDREITRDDNTRGGIGGAFKLNEKLLAGAEISGGAGGISGAAKLTYNRDENTSTYIGYDHKAEFFEQTVNSVGGYIETNGQFVLGGTKRFADKFTLFGEERLAHENVTVTGLTHAYGLDYKINDAWGVGIATELGMVKDTTLGELDRKAVSGNVAYTKDGFSYKGALEWRNEQGAVDERDSFLSKSGFNYKYNNELDFVGKVDAAVSTSSQGAFYDGKFIEAVAGFALRPIDNDTLNILGKYVFLFDLPAAQQLSASESLIDYKQKSHIFSLDAIWQVTESLSLGAKYGFKFGEITSSRTSDDWFGSTVHLGVLRADYHVVKQWDILAELRYLTVREAQDSKFGVLLAGYYHLMDNFKIGVGYNFTDFNDDLTNLGYDASGAFINLVTKF